MLKQRFRVGRALLMLALTVSIGAVGTATAQQSSSTNYSVNEVQFGSGGSLNDCSSNYCAKTSVGDTAVGSASSTNYQAQFGFNTSDEPMLEVIVTGGSNNLGVLDTSTTATATTQIKVRNYLSNGYVVQIDGPPPVTAGHTLTALSTQSSSQAGAEQFGINLVDNSAPDIGADPVQKPSAAYSFGTVASTYATPDLFKYNEGDVIAQSYTSTGETDYTLSMIINIANITPAGHYNGSFSAVVTAVF